MQGGGGIVNLSFRHGENNINQSTSVHQSATGIYIIKFLNRSHDKNREIHLLVMGKKCEIPTEKS